MIRSLALLLTLLTGFSGLVYQVAWQKYLAALLGSHAEATAAVLGIFLGGLSLGYALFGALTRRLVERAGRAQLPPPLLFAYGLVEVGIGVYALAFPLLFPIAQWLSLWLPLASEGLGFSADILLTALLIGPPTVLMGGTIPLLTQGLSRNLEDATRFHALVYSFNTAGAFAGALAAGFVLIPELGLRGSVVAMGIVNLSAGLAFLALGRRATATASVAEAPEVAPARVPHFALYATVAGLSGAAMMTLQTALNRIGALSLGASHFTFAMVVAIFVFSIAAGSLGVSALRRIPPSALVGSQLALVTLLIAAYPWVPDAPYWAHLVRVGLPGAEPGLHAYYFRIFGWGLALLIVPLGLSGATLPLLFHHLRSQVGDLGAVAGRLYAWNTVGSLVGALLGGYFLFFWLDLHHVYRIAVGALALGALLLTLQILPRARLWALGAAFATLAGLAALPPWQPERLSLGLFRHRAPLPHTHEGPRRFTELEWQRREIRFYDDDPAMSVAVVSEFSEGQPALSIINNGKSDSQIPGDNLTTGLLGLLPAILAHEPERAFVIGYGTGFTVGVLNGLESLQKVVVAEISSGVIQAAPLFEPYNEGASSDPRVEMIRSDAYRALLRSPERFDLIVSEPPNPWVAGVEMLFSREFLQAARSRLTPQGVYAQWFHLYEMDTPTTSLVLRTYLEAFDRVAVWSCTRTDIIILGFNDDQKRIDLRELEARFRHPDYQAAFRRIGIGSFPELLAHEFIPVDVLGEVGLPNRIHTILHPILSHDAALAFHRGGEATLPITTAREAAIAGAQNSLAGRYLAQVGPDLRASTLRAMAGATCRNAEDRCLGLLGRWHYEEPGSAALERTLTQLRRAREGADEALSDQNLAFIAQLFDPEGLIDVPHSYESAAQILRLFNRFYHHAVPFDSRALRKAWDRCRMDPRCAIEQSRIAQIGVPPAEERPQRAAGKAAISGAAQ